MNSLYRKLKKMDEQKLLEVEDLLETLHQPDPTTADEISQLATEHGWSRTGMLDGHRVVPLAMWAEIVSVFHREGLKGLIARGVAPDSRKEQAQFVLAALGELHSKEALEAAVMVCGSLLENPAEDPELSEKCASVFNTLLCFKPQVAAGQNSERIVRSFLHRLAQSSSKEATRAVAVLGLRAVGDSSSLEILKILPSFEHPWTDVAAVAARAIKKRLKAG